MTSRRKRKKLDSPPAIDQRWDRNLDKRYRRDYFFEGGHTWPAPVKYRRCRTCATHHPPVLL